jgi:hypothetical protein
MLASTVQFSRYGRQRPQPSASALPGAVPIRGRYENARFLRTQQCARPARNPGPPFRARNQPGRTNRVPVTRTGRIASAPLESMGARPGIR